MALLSDFERPRPPAPPEVSSLAQAVFALLVLATVAAFFITQKLKHEPSVVQQVRMTNSFGPLGVAHTLERVSFKIKHADEVTVTVVNSGGDDVTTLYGPRHLAAYHKLSLAWNGRLANGRLAGDGRYHVRIRLRNQNRTVLTQRSFLLNTHPPQPEVAAITDGTAAPTPGPAILPTPDRKPLEIAISPGSGIDPELFIYRTDVTPARFVEQLPLAVGATTASWDGTVHGRRVPSGTYVVAIRDHDHQGNIGVDPATLPTSGAPATLAALQPGQVARGRAGITVRHLGVEPPFVATAAGGPIEFGVDARRVGYSWSVTRIGAGHARLHGTSSRPLLKFTAPRGISGVYELAIQTRSHAIQVPFAVQGPGLQHVLVVLPAITWLGSGAQDEDGDGLPDTLNVGIATPTARVLSGDPPAFADRLAPLLAFLDRHHLRYDITTDLALGEHYGTAIRGHAGVLLAGDERWLPTRLQDELRAYVRHGGHLASLGVGSLRHSVTLRAQALSAPTNTAPTDTFGARIRPLVSQSVTLTNYLDQLGLFSGGGGQFSASGGYETTDSVGPQSALAASAVTPDGHPVIVAVRYGSGLVIRTGFAGFAASLGNGSASALFGQIWSQLEH